MDQTRPLGPVAEIQPQQQPFFLASVQLRLRLLSLDAEVQHTDLTVPKSYKEATKTENVYRCNNAIDKERVKYQ